MLKRFLLFFLLFFSMVPAEPSFAEDPVAGTITRVRGKVTARKTGDETTALLKAGDRITAGHILATSADSGCQLVFTDDSFVHVLPDTTLVVKQYSYSEDTGRRTAVVKVNEGRARFVVYKVRSRESRFTVETGQALLTVGISDFFVAALQSETEIANIGQSLRVKNTDSLTVGVVRLDANQISVIKDKTPPSQPAALPPEQRRKYLKDAQI